MGYIIYNIYLDSQTTIFRLSGVVFEFRGWYVFGISSLSFLQWKQTWNSNKINTAPPSWPSAKNDKPSHPTTKDRPSKFHRLIFLEQSSRNNNSYHPGTARASQMCSSLQRAHAADLADEVGSFMNVGHRTGGIPSGPFQNGKAANALGLEVLSHVKRHP